MATIGEGVIKIRSDTSGFGSGITSALGSVGKVAAASFTVASAAAIGFGVAAFTSAARVGEMDATLKALSKGNAATYASMQKTVSAIRASGIEAGVAQNLVAQFTRNQLDLSKATDLSRVAQDAAVISGRNSTEVLGDLVHGITTQNSLVLRNAGINVQAGKAMDEFAASIGKSAKELTDSERSQAVLNAVIAAGIPIAGAYAAAMEEPGKVLRSFPRVFDDIKVAVGKPLVDAFGPTIIAAYDFAKALSASLAPGGALNDVVTAIGKKLAEAAKPLTNFIKLAKDWVKAIKPEQVTKIVDAITKIGPAASSAGAGVFAMGAKSLPVIGGMLGGLNPLVVALGAFALTSSDVRDALGGLMSTLMPLVKDLIGGLLPALEGILKAAAPLLAVLAEFAIILGAEVLKAITPLVPLIVDLAEALGAALTDALKTILPDLIELLKILIPVAAAVAALLASGLTELVKVFTPLAPVILAVAAALKIMSVALGIAKAALALFGITMGAVTLPVWIWVAAIAAVIAGLVLAYKKIDWFRNAVDAVARAIAAGAKAVWGFITGSSELTKKLGIVGVALEAVFNPIRGLIDMIKGLVQIVTSVLKGDWSAAWDGLKLVVEGFLRYMLGVPMALISNFGGPVLDFFAGLAGKIGSALAGVGQAIAGAFTGAAGSVIGFFTSLPALAVDALKALPGLLREALEYAIAFMIVGAYYSIKGLWKFFTEIGPEAVRLLAALPGQLKSLASQVMAAMAAGFVTGAVAVFNFFLALPGRLLGYMTTAATWLKDAGVRILTGLYNGIIAGAVAVWSFFTGLPARIKGYFTAAIGWLTGSGKQVSDGLATGVTSGGQSLWDWLRGLPRRIVDAIVDAPGILYGVGRQIIGGLIRGIGDMAGAVGGAIKGVIDGGISKAKGILGIGSPSKVFATMGHQIGEGLVVGIESMVPAVGDAMDDLLAIPAAPAMDLGAVGAGADGRGAAAGAAPSYVLNIYPQTLDELGVLAAFRRLEMIGALR